MDSNDLIIFRAVLWDLMAILKGWLKSPYQIHNCLLHLKTYLFIFKLFLLIQFNLFMITFVLFLPGFI